MYGHGHNYGDCGNDPYGFPADFLTLPGLATPPPPPLQPQQHATNYFLSPPPVAIPGYELDSVYATSSGGYDSPSYTGSPGVVMARSGSSHSIANQVNNNGSFNQLVSSPTEFLDSEGSSSSVRRVFSASDLQGTQKVQHHHHHRSESPLSSESNSIIESMNKACRYSPEEKKERIERYRSKKNQRNFNKKIKYVCRKTLADSRPRIRGRFARNDEIEKTTENHCCSQVGGEEEFDEDVDDNWMVNFLDSFPPNLIP